MRRAALPALAVVLGRSHSRSATGSRSGTRSSTSATSSASSSLPGWLAYRALSRRPGGAAAPARDRLGARLRARDPRLHGDRGRRDAIAVRRLSAAGRGRGRRGHLAAPVRPSRRPDRAADDGARGGPPRYSAGCIAAVCLVAVAYIGARLLPGRAAARDGSVYYFLDYPRWIALAADAKHHWPIMDPSVAGEPLPYHYFVNIHLAAASQVTGLGLPLIYFRLFIFPLVVVSGAAAGRRRPEPRRAAASVGLIAACIAFFIGELRLDPSNTFLAHTPFFGLFFTFLFRSPSFLLGPGALRSPDDPRRRADQGEAGADPGRRMAAGRPVHDRRLGREGLDPAAADRGAGRLRRMDAGSPPVGSRRRCGARRGLALVDRARSARSSTAGIPAACASIRSRVFNLMPAVHADQGGSGGAPGRLSRGRTRCSTSAASSSGSFGLLAAPLVGIAWVFRDAVAASAAVAGLAARAARRRHGAGVRLQRARHPERLYFLFYGLVAGYVLSAEGLDGAWQRRPSLSGSDGSVAWSLGLAFAASLAS